MQRVAGLRHRHRGARGGRGGHGGCAEHDNKEQQDGVVEEERAEATIDPRNRINNVCRRGGRE